MSGFGTSLSVAQYVLCLCLLGLGWNLCYIGGTRLLVESHNEVETAKVQAINEFSIQVANTLAAFLAGPLLNEYGWEAVVWVGVPCVGITATVALAPLGGRGTGRRLGWAKAEGLHSSDG